MKKITDTLGVGQLAFHHSEKEHQEIVRSIFDARDMSVLCFLIAQFLREEQDPKKRQDAGRVFGKLLFGLPQDIIDGIMQFTGVGVQFSDDPATFFEDEAKEILNKVVKT